MFGLLGGGLSWGLRIDFTMLSLLIPDLVELIILVFFSLFDLKLKIFLCFLFVLHLELIELNPRLLDTLFLFTFLISSEQMFLQDRIPLGSLSSE